MSTVSLLVNSTPALSVKTSRAGARWICSANSRASLVSSPWKGTIALPGCDNHAATGSYIELLDATEFVDGYTTSADVKNTKPEPDIVHAAIEKAGGGPAVMIGDSTWDCKAATRAELPSIGVLTGGFSEQELTDAGATIVFDSVEHLREHLKTTSLQDTVSG